MTIFQALREISHTISKTYNQKRSFIQKDRQELEGVRAKTKLQFALRAQLEELLTQLKNDINIQSLTIEVDEDAEEYLTDVVSQMEAMIVPTDKAHSYLFMLKEEEL